ncbi:MAG: 30S ribosomal protein S8 [bacterium]
MNLTDPIADMLTRIKNALAAGLETVDMHQSKMKVEVARILKKEGYIRDYVVEGGSKKKILRIYLKYTEEREPVIQGIKRKSKPGLRLYSGAGKVPKIMGGMGVVVMSTPLGMMTGKEAVKRGVGGEIVCLVW